MSASASEGLATAFVVLKGGLTLPLEALRLALALEDRGATFAIEGDDLIIDGPREMITDADQVAIRRWKWHLMAIATYRPPELLK